MEEQSYDQPIRTVDYELDFTTEQMPDPNLNNLPAKLSVHRVYPVEEERSEDSVAKHAVVLIHGRTVPGPVVFDLQFTAPGGGELSVQRALARAGIDTYAPSLLGFGKSTRFSLDDPANASLPPYDDGTCKYGEGWCDRTSNPAIFPLDQQGDPRYLWVNPLEKERRKHSSRYRFARTDVWVRDIRQVIEDAIERAHPVNGKVALVGYSLGGRPVGRALYANQSVREKVSRVVFVNSIFFPNELPDDPETGLPTFPLTLNDRLASDVNWRMPNEPVGSEATCFGHIIRGTQEQVWRDTLKLDPLGSKWGGDDPHYPTGLCRAPTFSGYGWNKEVAGQLEIPTLVMQGLNDTVVPTGPGTGKTIYGALENAEAKVLVHVECASHALQWEGCSGDRCKPAFGETPYGGTQGEPWAGPHATLKAALIEWIKEESFNGYPNGSFTVNQRGVARADP